MDIFNFYKESDGRWYIDLPTWPGFKSELEMVSGADTMLDIMSSGSDYIDLTLSETEFDGADNLEFIRMADEIDNGAYYKMTSYKGVKFDLEILLCDVTKFVFGHFPKNIWVSTCFTLSV